MLKAVMIGIAAAVAFGGAAMAQPPGPVPSSPELLLVKDDGPGRKLGHYKHKNKHKHKRHHVQRDWPDRSRYGYGQQPGGQQPGGHLPGWPQQGSHQPGSHQPGPPSWAPAYGYPGASSPPHWR